MLVDQDIASVRAFNRLVTREAGALDDPYRGRRPLGECRVLFEIGARGATPRDIRARLGLDSGYLSRLLRSLSRDGLVGSAADPSDRRTKQLSLTDAGQAELRELDRIADELAAQTLAPLTEYQREELLQAQRDVIRVLAISMISIKLEDPSSADARWCLSHYFAELAERFEDPFDPERTLPAPPRELVPPDGAFLIARAAGGPAGCGALKTLEPGVGEITRMWVDRPHRGLGVAGRLLVALEERARELGHERVRLYTNRSLGEAQEMYRSRGYVEIERYNDDPYATHFFERVIHSRSSHEEI